MKLLYIGIIVTTCGFFIPLLYIVFYRWHRNRKGKRAPFTEKFLRSPGQSLNDQIQTLSEDILNAVFTQSFLPVLIFLLLVALHGLLQINKVNLILVLVFIIGAEIFACIKLKKSLDKRNNLRLGYDGEIAVGQELNLLMLDGYHVFHDLVTDKVNKFNIDHIIVGSSGVYAVETKARSKSKIEKGNDVNGRLKVSHFRS